MDSIRDRLSVKFFMHMSLHVLIMDLLSRYYHVLTHAQPNATTMRKRGVSKV